MLNNEEPNRKRSRLVLPSPQIDDQEMEQIVKLGKASEAARESVVDEDGEARPSDTLLTSYAVTPGSALRTPRSNRPSIPRACTEHMSRNRELKSGSCFMARWNSVKVGNTYMMVLHRSFEAASSSASLSAFWRATSAASSSSAIRVARYFWARGLSGGSEFEECFEWRKTTDLLNMKWHRKWSLTKNEWFKTFWNSNCSL